MTDKHPSNLPLLAAALASMALLPMAGATADEAGGPVSVTVGDAVPEGAGSVLDEATDGWLGANDHPCTFTVGLGGSCTSTCSSGEAIHVTASGLSVAVSATCSGRSASCTTGILNACTSASGAVSASGTLSCSVSGILVLSAVCDAS